jgi:hypothetical protein
MVHLRIGDAGDNASVSVGFWELPVASNRDCTTARPAPTPISVGPRIREKQSGDFPERLPLLVAETDDLVVSVRVAGLRVALLF